MTSSVRLQPERLFEDIMLHYYSHEEKIRGRNYPRARRYALNIFLAKFTQITVFIFTYSEYKDQNYASQSKK